MSTWTLCFSDEIKNSKLLMATALNYHASKLQSFPNPFISISYNLKQNIFMWSYFRFPRGQRVGGQLNVHVCPLRVGGWSKRGKNPSTWFLNAPLHHIRNLLGMYLCKDEKAYWNLPTTLQIFTTNITLMGMVVLCSEREHATLPPKQTIKFVRKYMV